MRVLLLSDVYFPRINGVSTALQTYRRGLAAAGIDTRLLAPHYGSHGEEAGLTRLKGWPVPRDPEDRIVPPWRFARAARAAAADCDLVHIHTPFAAHGAGLAAARAHGLPVLASYHTLFEEYLHHYAPFLPAGVLRAAARSVSRRQCNALDAVIVPSSPLAARLQQYGVTSPLHILPTGVPLEQFRRGDGAAFRQRHGIAPHRPVALYVGRAAFEKNIGLLIDALARALPACPDLLLLIAGEGPARASLEARARSLGLEHSVRFLGYLDREHELPDCYAAATLFAFASRTETQGLVLIEAMAAGLPVVALAEMGTCDILTAASGAHTPAASAEAFAAALLAVINNPLDAARRAEQGREWARSWRDDALTARLASLYHSLARRQSAPEAAPAAAGQGLA